MQQQNERKKRKTFLPYFLPVSYQKYLNIICKDGAKILPFLLENNELEIFPIPSASPYKAPLLHRYWDEHQCRYQKLFFSPSITFYPPFFFFTHFDFLSLNLFCFLSFDIKIKELKSAAFLSIFQIAQRLLRLNWGPALGPKRNEYLLKLLHDF